MGQRLNLHTLLKTITSNVYFQPPPSSEISYPCIVYNRSKILTRFADNIPYSHEKRYAITVIDADPDSELPDKVSNLQRCSFDRHFVSDNLNHDVFNIIF